MALGAPERWRLRSDARGSNHPFHIHTNHFMVLPYRDELAAEAAAAGVGGWAPSVGQYMDTVGVMGGFETDIAFVAADFTVATHQFRAS